MSARPLLHFMVLGALLFGVRLATDDGRLLGLGREPIRVSAVEVARLRAEWRAETRREPGRAELEAMIRRHADEAALLREALRLGLDRGDPVVRSRLVQNLRFARGEPDGEAGVLFAEALALGMATRDLVARRRLVQAMEERIAREVRIDADEVRAYVAAHPDRYGALRRVSFDQVFIDPAVDPARLERRATAVAASLVGPVPGGSGDPFLAGSRFENKSQADLARVFGGAFAQAALAAPAGAWTGPIRSAYGLHFIRVEAAAAGGTVELERVERQARYALLEEREREAVRERLQALRRAYPLAVEWPALIVAEAP